VLHFPRLALSASVQQIPNTLPTFAGDQRLVRVRVRAAVAIELATAQLETFSEGKETQEPQNRVVFLMNFVDELRRGVPVAK
jgi:hypothetical protein